MKKYVLSVAVCALSAGCATSVVKSMPAGFDATSPGVTYYLPKQLLNVTFKRAKPPTEKEVAEAVSKAKTAKAEASSLAAMVKLIEGRLEKYENAKTIEDESANLDKLRVIAAEAKDAADDADELAKSEEAKLKLVAGTSAKFVDTFSIMPGPVVADTSQRYVAVLNHSLTRSNDLKLTTNARGLLTTTDLISTDQTGQILINIASAVAGLPVGTPGSRDFAEVQDTGEAGDVKCTVGKYGPTEVKKDAGLFTLPMSIDPTTDAFESLAYQLCLRGADYRFEWQAMPASPPCADKEPPSGLRYRRLLPSTLIILGSPIPSSKNSTESTDSTAEEKGEAQAPAGAATAPVQSAASCTAETDGKKPDTKAEKGKEARPIIQSLTFNLPNNSPADIIDLKAGQFVKTQHKLAFENGMLTSYEEDRPSTLLAISSLPVEIGRALISIPAELLSLKVDYRKREVELLGADAALLKQMQELEDLRTGAAATDE